MKRKMKPLNLFVPITRTEKRDNGLLVEGYCYVNAECGDGINLTRKAMEAAASDYMKWGAVREMHGPSAAGTAESVEFDDKGAFLRALIVDKDAIDKVEAKVYKGFSVGVRGKVMRGNKVESCDWIENSLVDRPADPDAVFAIARAENADTSEADVEVLDEEEIERAATTCIQHYSCGSEYGCHGHTTEGGAQECRERQENEIDRYIEHLQSQIRNLRAQRGDDPEIIRQEETALTRLQALEGETADLVQRAETAEASLTRVQGELDTASAEIERLKKQPAPVNNQVRFPGALERSFTANDGGDTAAIDPLVAEYARLQEDLPKETDPQKRHQGVVRMSSLKSTIHALGGRV